MLELCFARSVRGCLRVAQHCGGGGIRVRADICAVSDREQTPGEQAEFRRSAEAFRRYQEALEREAVPLGGDPRDVLTLSLGLDMGDIRDPLGEVRRELLRQWYGSDGTGHRDQALRAAKEYWRQSLDAAERLKKCGPGDTVRIWADPTPYSACGLLHAASLLKDTKAAVRVVFPPHWLERPDGTVEVCDQSWGEVAPELFSHFLSREEPVPRTALLAMARRWEELQRENAPLRAVVNGSVRSVGADFYDDLIRRHIPGGRTKVAHIIGDVLGRERPGIGDVWLAERIRWMLSAGELRMVREDPERFYGSLVEKA